MRDGTLLLSFTPLSSPNVRVSVRIAQKNRGHTSSPRRSIETSSSSLAPRLETKVRNQTNLANAVIEKKWKVQSDGLIDMMRRDGLENAVMVLEGLGDETEFSRGDRKRA